MRLELIDCEHILLYHDTFYVMHLISDAESTENIQMLPQGVKIKSISLLLLLKW